MNNATTEIKTTCPETGRPLWVVRTVCGRCHGAGIVGHYLHIEGGACFACHGRRYFTKTYKSSPETRAKRAATRAAKAAVAAQLVACAAAPAALAKAVVALFEDRITAAARAAKAHVGTVGTRGVFELTVVGVTGWDSHYGFTRLYIFEDAAGNDLTWKTGTGSLDTTRGAKVTVKATVKAHTEYRGAAQTQLTRVKEVA